MLDTHMPSELTSNIAWIRGRVPRDWEPAFAHREMSELQRALIAALNECTNPNQQFWKLCEKFERDVGIGAGIGLRVGALALDQGSLRCDLFGPRIYLQPVRCFSATPLAAAA
jgi:hypothetical protein